MFLLKKIKIKSIYFERIASIFVSKNQVSVLLSFRCQLTYFDYIQILSKSARKNFFLEDKCTNLVTIS